MKKKSTDEIVQEVGDGKWGSGVDRRNRLDAAGYDYNTIQAKVEEVFGKERLPQPKKTLNEIALEIVKSGKAVHTTEMREKIVAEGFDYSIVAAAVNDLMYQHN